MAISYQTDQKSAGYNSHLFVRLQFPYLVLILLYPKVVTLLMNKTKGFPISIPICLYNSRFEVKVFSHLRAVSCFVNRLAINMLSVKHAINWISIWSR
ncbi:hypothetical protein BLOT_005249 [Blomia tropicalis]|nr:hypothetical protein BLOT_005249 [Blomia tropicalis]